MLKLYVWIKDLFRREEGQEAVRYALITAIVGLAIITIPLGLWIGAFQTWLRTWPAS